MEMILSAAGVQKWFSQLLVQVSRCYCSLRYAFFVQSAVYRFEISAFFQILIFFYMFLGRLESTAWIV